MKRLILLLMTMLMTAAYSTTAFAKSFIVYDFKSSASNKNDARVMARLLRAELARMKNSTVKTAPSKSCVTASCARKTRHLKDVDAVVVGELEYLGSKLLLFVTAVWEDGTVEYPLELKNTEEFKRLAERLAKSIYNRKTFESEMGIDSVARSEEHPFNVKQHGDVSLGLVGHAWAPLSGSYMDVPGLYGFMIQLKYEVGDLGFELDTGYIQGNSNENDLTIRELAVDLSLLYYFAKRDRTPFIGGTLGIHGVELVNNDDANFGAEVQRWAPMAGGFIGYEIGRAQMFSFHIRAGYKGQYMNLQDEFGGQQFAHGPFLGIGLSFF